MAATKHKPLRIERRFRGHDFRFQTDDRGRFDEVSVVIGKDPKPGMRGGLVLHAEMCDSRSGYVDVCGVQIWFAVGRDGIARITMSEDHREGVGACPDLRDPAFDRKPTRRAR